MSSLTRLHLRLRGVPLLTQRRAAVINGASTLASKSTSSSMGLGDYVLRYGYGCGYGHAGASSSFHTSASLSGGPPRSKSKPKSTAHAKRTSNNGRPSKPTHSYSENSPPRPRSRNPSLASPSSVGRSYGATSPSSSYMYGSGDAGRYAPASSSSNSNAYGSKPRTRTFNDRDSRSHTKKPSWMERGAVRNQDVYNEKNLREYKGKNVREYKGKDMHMHKNRDTAGAGYSAENERELESTGFAFSGERPRSASGASPALSRLSRSPASSGSRSAWARDDAPHASIGGSQGRDRGNEKGKEKEKEKEHDPSLGRDLGVDFGYFGAGRGRYPDLRADGGGAGRYPVRGERDRKSEWVDHGAWGGGRERVREKERHRGETEREYRREAVDDDEGRLTPDEALEAGQEEFYHPPQAVSSVEGKEMAVATTATFSSPPLLAGFVSALREMFGRDATPTPIQGLSLRWVLEKEAVTATATTSWRQFLLAAETGSGKSIAYLLPLLQNLKLAEATPPVSIPTGERRKAHNPRALILAPTHELARQLAGFAKDLVHHPDTKLRVMCMSQSNEKERRAVKMTDGVVYDQEVGAPQVTLARGKSHPVDVVVGTPMKLLEMTRGRGWDRSEDKPNEDEHDDDERKLRRGRDKMPHFGTWKTRSDLGLQNVEWVVVDEADVLFDPDFQETTRQLLADISAARGHPVSVSIHTPTQPVNYPFHLLLTSATIPNALNTYLAAAHPALVRLASPRLHKLPKNLQTEYVAWTGGNKFADILRRLRRVWAEDAMMVGAGHDADRPAALKEKRVNGRDKPELSKVVIFANKTTKALELSRYLTEQGVRNVPVTSRPPGGRGSEDAGVVGTRERFSNKHLEGFLRVREKTRDPRSSLSPSHPSPIPKEKEKDKETPRVLLTTSLLSRGLDFSPAVKHVFIIDEPRNMIDFLHRAGRAGRAGERGRVVVFGKMKGRGSKRGREIRGRVGRLV